MRASNLNLGELAQRQLQLIAQLCFQLLLKLRREHPMLCHMEDNPDLVRILQLRIERGMGTNHRGTEAQKRKKNKEERRMMNWPSATSKVGLHVSTSILSLSSLCLCA